MIYIFYSLNEMRPLLDKPIFLNSFEESFESRGSNLIRNRLIVLVNTSKRFALMVEEVKGLVCYSFIH